MTVEFVIVYNVVIEHEYMMSSDKGCIFRLLINWSASLLDLITKVQATRNTIIH